MRYPVVAVGAAIVKGENILLVKRSKEPLRGYWTLPGGRVKNGETLEEAVVREILEELNLKIKPEKILYVSEILKKDKKGKIEFHYVIVDFLVRSFRGKVHLNEESLSYGWFNQAELERLRITGDTKRCIKKAFGSL